MMINLTKMIFLKDYFMNRNKVLEPESYFIL